MYYGHFQPKPQQINPKMGHKNNPTEKINNPKTPDLCVSVCLCNSIQRNTTSI